MKKLILFLCTCLIGLCASCNKEPQICDKFYNFSINIPKESTIEVPAAGQTFELQTNSKDNNGNLCILVFLRYYPEGEGWVVPNNDLPFGYLYDYEDEVITWDFDLKNKNKGTLTIKPNNSGKKRKITFCFNGGILSDETFFTITQKAE